MFSFKCQSESNPPESRKHKTETKRHEKKNQIRHLQYVPGVDNLHHRFVVGYSQLVGYHQSIGMGRQDGRLCRFWDMLLLLLWMLDLDVIAVVCRLFCGLLLFRIRMIVLLLLPILLVVVVVSLP